MQSTIRNGSGFFVTLPVPLRKKVVLHMAHRYGKVYHLD